MNLLLLWRRNVWCSVADVQASGRCDNWGGVRSVQVSRFWLKVDEIGYVVHGDWFMLSLWHHAYVVSKGEGKSGKLMVMWHLCFGKVFEESRQTIEVRLLKLSMFFSHKSCWLQTEKACEDFLVRKYLESFDFHFCASLSSSIAKAAFGIAAAAGRHFGWRASIWSWE